ncbi:YciI family protein [Streptomyces sp. H34-S4]|uniref:YciI family protein n=1 Tax=Streptomyces sp. H34-S4 TaxID=2996463 RepID=UPI00226E89AF|nr:YciI family protein [Streptomyces sp. H34-S4]MCY0937597.1 YciI family protein [Streptomyces sp. H34-S4]
MAQYAVFIYEAEIPGGWENAPAELLAAHEAFPGKVEELGGKILNGLALQPAGTAKAIRGGEVVDGPFSDAKQAIGGTFVLEARDIEHALEVAKVVPVHDGGVEVRPLFEAPENPEA